MSDDPRIEAAAKALFESTRTDYMTWDRAHEETRALYRSRMLKNVTAYLAADDDAATIARVREALSNHPKVCDKHADGEPIACGWKRAVADVTHALDGGA